MATYRDMRFAAWAERAFNWDIKPVLLDLAVDDPRIDPVFEAQRNLDDERASQMAEHYMAAAAAGVIVALLPNGRLLFVDGQHRWKAAKDAGVSSLAALAFEMGDEQASVLFRLKNGPAIKLVRHIESTNAATIGGDPRFIHLRAICAGFDCFLDRENSRSEGAINASSIVEKIYNVDDGDLLITVLETITEAWGHARQVLTGAVLEGVALFLAHHEDQLRTSELRDLKDKLSKQGFEDLWAQARGSYKRAGRAHAGQTVHVEQEIVTTYNQRRSARRLPERSARQLAQLPDLEHLARATHQPILTSSVPLAANELEVS